MPILAKEIDLYPANLLEACLEVEQNAVDSECHWWAMYTMSRREKQLMRKLCALEIPFYGPTISRRFRSPAGRVRIAHDPLFSNYVFVYGDEAQRYTALATNCVSRCYPVKDGLQLTQDLLRINQLIELGQPLTPEATLAAGDRVRIKTGTFAGFEGTIIRRQGETRLLVSVDFMQQGASVLLDDCQMERL